jgi:GNAT superfamily N-acetyltransferase
MPSAPHPLRSPAPGRDGRRRLDDAGLTPSGLLIRRAEPRELAACAALYERVLRATFIWTDPATHRAADFLEHAREEEVYAAFEIGKLVGIAGFYRPANFLHSLYVDRRGHGVGKALLEHVCRAADGPVSLKVQEANVRARAFYRREGFRLVERGFDPPPGVAWRRLRREVSAS